MTRFFAISKRVVVGMLAIPVVTFSSTIHAGSYDDLIQASKMGDVPTMHSLMKRGLDPDSTDRSGNTLLSIASMEGNEKLVKVLLQYKPKLNALNQHGETALQLAAYRGHVAIVQDLLTAGAKTDVPGWPPLIYAVYAGHEAIVDMLLNAGADRDAKASNGQTALMFAVQGRKNSIVKRLLAAGVDPDVATVKGETAYSMSLRTEDPEITKLVEDALERWHLKLARDAALKQQGEANQEKTSTVATNTAAEADSSPQAPH